MNPPPWPPERVALVLALLGAGRSYSAIAVEVGVSRHALRRCITRHGLPRPPDPAVWPSERVALVLALLEAGRRYKDIAAQLGTSRSAVAGIVYRRRPAPPPIAPLEARLGWDRVTQPGCRWIAGDPAAEWQWCGAALDGPGPYCAAHRARVWQRIQPAVHQAVSPKNP